MGSVSIWHWLIVVAVVSIVFGGKGKISDIMGQGHQIVQKGPLAEVDKNAEVQHPSDPPMRTIDHQTAADPDRKLG